MLGQANLAPFPNPGFGFQEIEEFQIDCRQEGQKYNYGC